METKNNISKKTYPVTGMHCASCTNSVQSILTSQNGVQDANVNLATNSVLVEFDQKEIKPEGLKKAVQSIGYDLLIDEDDDQSESIEEYQRLAYSKLIQNTAWAGALSIPMVILSMVFPNWSLSGIISAILATPVVFYFGRRFFIGAWKQLQHKKANMDSLVALSTSIAYFFSLFNLVFPETLQSRGLEAHVYFEAAAVIIFFILVGKLLEERAKTQTASSIKKLIGLQPKKVTILDEHGHESEKGIKDVQVGDRILIVPGQKIPVDGKVIDGQSAVDESTLTGEPIPVDKDIDDTLTSGTHNISGSLVMEATKVGESTFLNQLIKLVQEAQGSRTPVQNLVDKIAGVFVPTVIGLSILTLLSWLIFGGDQNVTHGILSMVTVLVIACPCALGLATPTALMVGVGKGSDNGILVKNAQSLEHAHQVDTVVLDKTGTITEGKPSVSSIKWLQNEAHYAPILKTLESKSEHPLANAVSNFLDSIDSYKVQSFSNLPGKGVMATVENKNYFVGSQKLLSEMKLELDTEDQDQIKSWESEGETVVYFFTRQEVLAIIGLADSIKRDSSEAIKKLKDKGIHVIMLTGDHAGAAKAIAERAGIEHFEASLLPHEKGEFIQKLQSEGRKVAMIGDGINDTHALSLADLSIAMGQGADIAIDTASMTIISSNLNKIPEALQLSHQTIRTIRQNLFWAFIYNLIGIPIAAGLLYPINGFLLNPMIAGAAMAMSSVSVVTNSLRLKFMKL
ncbi:cation-translocating P-type ATPase [Marinoscillum sp. MHG1-6]|uniref:heavy metal translocating P-type ATPase n=1 Tax=Marinoscillum sp. MHG1-6 TaxID=2959627 RepID=UPI00215839D2|nr:heavy metal translocating P-type ATPase [Marinoscillum sp. MHG1-6]